MKTATERGSASLLLIGVVSATVLGLSFLSAGMLTAAKLNLQNRADFYALNAADALSGRLPGYPCEQVRTLALSEGLALHSCVASGLEIRVILHKKFGPVDLSARAHAGPPKNKGNLTSR